MRNNWQLCCKNPPPQYTRIEIKKLNGERCVGYRCKNTYYETLGNYIISDPYKWRWIPKTSTLLAEIKEKIKSNSLMEVGYGCNKK